MIPLKLQIRNFLSYGPDTQAITFTGHKLICFSGKNGHGKSALLDAITWAVWGQARKIGATSKPDEGLLRLGQLEMSVCYDFEFNKQRYRIRRDFSKKYGKPHTNLEFGLLRDVDYFVGLTEKTLRKTQEKIEQTLGLDYETFTNSSFLKQNGANEFSKKSAKERKDILCTILGLQQYDKARIYALEQVRMVSNNLENSIKLGQRLQQEYEELAHVPKTHQITLAALESVTKEETELEQEKKQLAHNQQMLRKELQEYERAKIQQEQLMGQELSARTQLTQLLSQWKKNHALLITLPDKQALEKEYTHLMQAVQDEQTALTQTLALKESLVHKRQVYIQQQTAAEKKLVEQQHYHELALERLKGQIEHLSGQEEAFKRAQAEITQKTGCIDQRLATLQTTIDPTLLMSDSVEQQRVFDRSKARYLQWIEQGNWVNSHLKELDHKQQLSHDRDNPSCPLCEQNLSQARKRFLQKKLLTEREFLTHRFERLKKGIAHLKARLHTHHEQLGQLKEFETLTARKLELAKEIETTAQACVRTEQEKNSCLVTFEQQKKNLAIMSITHTQAMQALLQPQEQAIKALETQLLATEYNVARHKELSTALKQVQERLTYAQELSHHSATQQECAKQVHTLCYSLKKMVREKEQIQAQTNRYAMVMSKAQEWEAQEQAIMFKAAQLIKKKEQLLEQKGTVHAQQLKRTQLEQEQATCIEQQKKITVELQELQQIATALGKDGIQALLIEDAIPEIEEEANDLLARLTDNQASITIESLRDLKRGGTRETLDINISDSQGIRPYELFSGGEAFRIDFALRIALSKLLARRAGTSLQTLIIDEGFGSQDDEGLSRMMDALHTIQEDFEKIIIVSHLPTMKEQFPVHFIITKDPQGSKVTVLENG